MNGCLHASASVGRWGRVVETVVFNWSYIAGRRSWITSVVGDRSFFVRCGSGPGLLSLLRAYDHVLYRDCSGLPSGSV